MFKWDWSIARLLSLMHADMWYTKYTLFLSVVKKTNTFFLVPPFTAAGFALDATVVVDTLLGQFL